MELGRMTPRLLEYLLIILSIALLLLLSSCCDGMQLPSLQWKRGRLMDHGLMSKSTKTMNMNNNNNNNNTVDRRDFVAASASALLVPTTTTMMMMMLPKPCPARELITTDQITTAVTQSELGKSVRRSVVQGAQVMDQFDQKIERLADRFQLGTARQSQSRHRPLPKIIPPLQPFDVVMARQIIDLQDRIFCSETKIDPKTLQATIDSIAQKARPAYQRSGANLSVLTSSNTTTSQCALINPVDYNFLSYVHYKAYLDLILLLFNNNNDNNNINFPRFKTNFDRQVAAEVLSLWNITIPSPIIISTTTTTTTTREKKQDLEPPTRLQLLLHAARACIDQIGQCLINQGLISWLDQAPIDLEQINDWSIDRTDVTWTCAVDGDITLQSQLLLQEQGYRFYPNLAHQLIEYILHTAFLVDQDVTVEDYYLDTDYNSDPSKFEVKEVLINIRLESL